MKLSVVLSWALQVAQQERGGDRLFWLEHLNDEHNLDPDGRIILKLD
jgi:hypothetical protein